MKNATIKTVTKQLKDILDAQGIAYEMGETVLTIRWTSRLSAVERSSARAYGGFSTAHIYGTAGIRRQKEVVVPAVKVFGVLVALKGQFGGNRTPKARSLESILNSIEKLADGAEWEKDEPDFDRDEE
jgi:hypothetical protein